MYCRLFTFFTQIVFFYLNYTLALPDGIEVTPGMYGYAAAITDKGKYLCGGTIVSNYAIISAAHCFKRGFNMSAIQVVVGVQNLSHKKSKHIKDVSHVVLHPRYSEIDKDFDIAILRPTNQLYFSSSKVQRIRLATRNSDHHDDEGVVFGWGKASAYSDDEIKLRFNRVRVWSPEECTSFNVLGPNAFEVYGPLVSERMLCASVPDGGPGTCDDDDGGGLIVNNEFVGVLSWRYDCKTLGKSSVYTSIALLRTYIEKVVLFFEN